MNDVQSLHDFIEFYTTLLGQFLDKIHWPADVVVAEITGFGIGLLFSALFYLAIVRGYDKKMVAKEMRRSKEQFISLCSHYLLSPITIIQTAVTSLQEAGPSMTEEKKDRLLDAIFRGQQRLWILAEQFLLVQQVQDNSFKLAIAVGNMTDVVNAAVIAVDSFARDKKVSIYSTSSLQQMEECRMDVRRFKTAMISLLDNAIKFSPEGGRVAVDLRAEGGMFIVTVSDQGTGMTKDVLSHLSEGFFRGTSVYSFDQEGIGIGIYLAQSIIRLHGGNILFNSGPGKGTLVTVQFPIE
jgi:signal transduction histidine kinase